MNIATARTRLAVSPYARRLAHERSLPLETLRGSGPGGRILAADVLSSVPVATPVVSPGNAAQAAPSPTTSRIAAFVTSVALGALQDLLAALENSGHVFAVDDVVLRAVGRAFADMPEAAVFGGASVALELAGRQTIFATMPEMSLTSLRAKRLAASAGSHDETETPAVLSLRLLPASDIRPVTMPLLPGRAMRLTVSPDTPGYHVDCLLTIDAASVDEDAAAAWLATLRSAIEQPLRLFV